MLAPKVCTVIDVVACEYVTDRESMDHGCFASLLLGCHGTPRLEERRPGEYLFHIDISSQPLIVREIPVPGRIKIPKGIDWLTPIEKCSQDMFCVSRQTNCVESLSVSRRLLSSPGRVLCLCGWPELN
jgi:hypothetical protein